METKNLRKKIKKIMVDKGLDNISLAAISEMINVNQNSLSMALTGYRETNGSLIILKKLEKFLSE